MERIPLQTAQETMAAVLLRLGFSADRAAICAQLFAEASCDGVSSHGVDRFPRFVAMVRNGAVDPAAAAERVQGWGALERWDGRSGAGNLNARAAMNQAITLSREHGVGWVSLGNTNHWMRGGSYGWQAAEAGVIAICWTNTMPNLPPWGGVEPCLGNNPLVMAVPRSQGHVVLDMAISQFSYGALSAYRQRGEPLPVEGGFDQAGHLTRDAAAIERSQRPLAIGYWKGSGLAMLLDLIAATTALGRATHQIPADPLRETGISQVFLAVNPAALGGEEQGERIADEIVASVHGCQPSAPGGRVRYPGEQTLRLREENLRLGIPVERAVWEQILAL
jgi:3-dehydro-L-gulonate 2-dehydrogenase